MNIEGISIEANRTQNLETLEFDLPKIASISEPEILDGDAFEATFNGVSVEVSLLSNSYLSKENNLFVRIEIFISNKKKFTEKIDAHMVLSISKYKSTEYIASTTIINSNRDMKGLGITLFKHSYKLIQKLSSKIGMSIKDKVNKTPSLGLSEDKWDEIFVSTLKDNGYEKKGEKLWEKIYLPEKND